MGHDTACPNPARGLRHRRHVHQHLPWAQTRCYIGLNTHTQTHMHSRNIAFYLGLFQSFLYTNRNYPPLMCFWISHQVANSSFWWHQREGTVCFSDLVIGIIILPRSMALWPVSNNKTARKLADAPCGLISPPLLHTSGCVPLSHLHVSVRYRRRQLGLRNEYSIDIPKTAIPQMATWGGIQKKVHAHRAAYLNFNFTATINMFAAWYKTTFQSW